MGQPERLPDLRIPDLGPETRPVVTARESVLERMRRHADLRRALEPSRAVRAGWGERLALVRVA